MIIAYYTALVLGYTLDGERIVTRFWLDSYEQCIEAMDHLEHMYDYIADHVASDNRIYMWCDKSTVRSATPLKPKPRPEGETKWAKENTNQQDQ
tara:strand:- start:143 stop:424 length:282 start_codon:yes stop_codon:yes gene_type:complete